MRLSLALLLGAVGLGAGCATSEQTIIKSSDGGTEPGSSNVDPDDPNAPPHAVGTIVLGETRASATGDSVPVIIASFAPSSTATKKSCGKKIGVCDVVTAPKCETGTIEGCKSGEVCSFDDDCSASCVKACTKTCAAGEECVRSSSAPADNGMACSKIERFDAGAIAFQGTTTSLTLFPPYAIKPDGNGAPFMARSEIHVQATGAAVAGFSAFDERFTSTTFMEANPPLPDIDVGSVFGSGSVTVGWVPGEDSVIVNLSSIGGSAKCTAVDKTGTFEISRDLVNTVLGKTSASSTSVPATSLSITLSRQRREMRTDKKTLGTLSSHKVEPVGWLELTTTSSETHTFQKSTACTSGLTSCTSGCVDTKSDPANCGGCNFTCSFGQTCSFGSCM